MENSFAKGNNFYKMFWIFFTGSFFGVAIEVIWCFLTRGKIECRQGLIYGPFNVVYGFGALTVSVVLWRIRNSKDIYIMICGAFLGGMCEYISSLVQETITGTVSWDYSKSLFNFYGRTNLVYCVLWGMLALVWCKKIYPGLSYMIEKIPNKLGYLLTWICVIFMTVNIIISTFAIHRMDARQNGVEAHTGVDAFLDRYYPDNRVSKIYPHIRFVKSGKKSQKIHTSNTNCKQGF